MPHYDEQQDCTPVSTMAFDLLVDISTHMLSEAHKSADFSSPVTLISVASQLYFTDSNSKRVFLLVRADRIRAHCAKGVIHVTHSLGHSVTWLPGTCSVSSRRSEAIHSGATRTFGSRPSLPRWRASESSCPSTLRPNQSSGRRSRRPTRRLTRTKRTK